VLIGTFSRYSCYGWGASSAISLQRGQFDTKFQVEGVVRFAFLAPFRVIRATIDDHLRLIEKRVVDFLLVLFELFSLGVTAEALRAHINPKLAISLQRGPVNPKLQVKGSKFHQPFFFWEN